MQPNFERYNRAYTSCKTHIFNLPLFLQCTAVQCGNVNREMRHAEGKVAARISSVCGSQPKVCACQLTVRGVVAFAIRLSFHARRVRRVRHSDQATRRRRDRRRAIKISEPSLGGAEACDV